MPNELSSKLSWTFYREVDTPREVYEMLVPGERAEASFKTVRDVATFTNLRLIVRDSQGLTGKKVEQYSLPWKAVDMWSSENAGHLNLDSEIELWTRAGLISIELKRGADVRRIDNLIAAHILGGGVSTVASNNATPVPSPQPQPQPQPEPNTRGGMLGGMNPFRSR